MTISPSSTGDCNTSRQATLWDQFTRPGNVDICQNNHKGNLESVAANKRVDKQTGKRLVLRAITALGEASSEQVEEFLSWPHQSVSARFSELKSEGLIVKTGTWPTKTGALAGVYKVA